LMISILLSVIVVGCLLHLLSIGRRERGLPPGPPTVPLLGNIHLLPNVQQMHLKFMEWSRKYGEVFSIKIGSTTMVVLSSPTAIQEIVDKNSWAANSRPVNYLAGLAAGGYHILFAADSMPIHLPNSFTEYYGQRVSSLTSPKMQGFYQVRFLAIQALCLIHSQTLHRFLHILLPGVYPPLDLVPALKYLPERWAPWLAACRRSKSETAAFHLEHSSSRIGTSTMHTRKCFPHAPATQTSQLWADTPGFSLVEAGSDTSAAFLLSLVLILAVYPEHQERARREIEAVVGAARLPELADFKHLPFVEALIKEVIRIRPAFPMGIPHFTTEEIRASYLFSCKSAFLTASPTAVQELHSVFHNPDIFEEPEVFRPERFMLSEHGTRPGMDTGFRDNFLFGAGRRICPGQSVAQATMQLTTMRLLWAFSFSTAIDPKTGRAIGRELDFYDHEFVVMPHAFECTIQLRSCEQRDVVAQAFNDAKSLLRQYEH
ncbi:cytochrome P450, partial [Mycena olivaceomarginata]